MPESNQQELKQLKKRRNYLKSNGARANCKGDPGKLRDLREELETVEGEIRRLERR